MQAFATAAVPINESRDAIVACWPILADETWYHRYQLRNCLGELDWWYLTQVTRLGGQHCRHGRAWRLLILQQYLSRLPELLAFDPDWPWHRFLADGSWRRILQQAYRRERHLLDRIGLPVVSIQQQPCVTVERFLTMIARLFPPLSRAHIVSPIDLRWKIVAMPTAWPVGPAVQERLLQMIENPFRLLAIAWRRPRPTFVICAEAFREGPLRYMIETTWARQQPAYHQRLRQRQQLLTWLQQQICQGHYQIDQLRQLIRTHWQLDLPVRTLRWYRQQASRLLQCTKLASVDSLGEADRDLPQLCGADDVDTAP